MKRNLVVTRKKDESIVIGPTTEPVVVTVCRSGKSTVKLLVQAEETTRVTRRGALKDRLTGGVPATK
ncbi:MAG: carbon storage regulator [Planctomycetota bacterium]|nr:carbon storage regulator [Planctomycetota bacterium]